MKKINKTDKRKPTGKKMSSESAGFKEGQAVDLVIGEKSELGYTAKINDRASGILYHTEIFESLHKNQKKKGFVKKVREDGKIDLCLQKPGYAKVPEISEQIIQKIAENGGFLEVTDKSSAELIYKLFGISKKNFKKAIGALYKARRIVIEEDGIALSE